MEKIEHALIRPSDLARFWSLHPKTIHGWIREGSLTAIRTPGAQFRVRTEDVVSFCASEGLAVPPFVIPPKKRVVAIAPDAVALRTLRRATSRRSSAVVHPFDDALTGLFDVIRTSPSLVLMDSRCGGIDARKVIRALRDAQDDLPIFIASAPSRSRAEVHVKNGATHAFAKGEERDLSRAIISLLSTERVASAGRVP